MNCTGFNKKRELVLIMDGTRFVIIIHEKNVIEENQSLVLILYPR